MNLRRSSTFLILLLLGVLNMAGMAVSQQSTVPEEARRYYVQANTLFRTAQSKDDFQQVLALYRQALAVDPQYGNAWYNLSKVQEKLEQYDDAIASLKRFLAVSPNDPEARAAQDHEYELEALKGKAESPEAIWAKFLQSLDGGVWLADAHHYQGSGILNNRFVIVIHNGMLILESVGWADGQAEPDPSQGSISEAPYRAVGEAARYPITSRRLTIPLTGETAKCGSGTYQIAESGDTITYSYSCLGNTWVTSYVRKR